MPSDFPGPKDRVDITQNPQAIQALLRMSTRRDCLVCGGSGQIGAWVLTIMGPILMFAPCQTCDATGIAWWICYN